MFETFNRLQYRKRKIDGRLVAIKDIYQKIYIIAVILGIISALSMIALGIIAISSINYTALCGMTIAALFLIGCICIAPFVSDYKYIIISEFEYQNYKECCERTDKVYHGELKGTVISWNMKIYSQEKYNELLAQAEEEKYYY